MENYNSRYASGPSHALIFGKRAVSPRGNDNSQRALAHFTYFRRGGGNRGTATTKTTFPGIPTSAHTHFRRGCDCALPAATAKRAVAAKVRLLPLQ